MQCEPCCDLRAVQGWREPGLFGDAKVDRDGRLVVQCEDQPEEIANLATVECLRAVLGRLRDEARVSGVVLAHDRERECGPRALAVLDVLLGLARLLDQFGERSPDPDFPGFDAKEVEAVCDRCQFRPGTMFPALRETVLGDPAGFVSALKAHATALDAFEETGCRSCTKATDQDLRILIEETSKVVKP